MDDKIIEAGEEVAESLTDTVSEAVKNNDSIFLISGIAMGAAGYYVCEHFVVPKIRNWKNNIAAKKSSKVKIKNFKEAKIVKDDSK